MQTGLPAWCPSTWRRATALEESTLARAACCWCTTWRIKVCTLYIYFLVFPLHAEMLRLVRASR